MDPDEQWIVQKLGKFTGHLCGIFAVFFISLSCFGAYKTFGNFNIGPIFITCVFLIIALLLFKLAGRLISDNDAILFPSYCYLIFLILTFSITIFLLTAAILKMLDSSVSYTEILFITLIIFMTSIVTNFFRKEFLRQRNKEKINSRY